jgi:hypothetical protein
MTGFESNELVKKLRQLARQLDPGQYQLIASIFQRRRPARRTVTKKKKT